MKIVGVVLLAFALGLIVAFCMAWPTEMLWNELMPTLFKCPEIGFWQAFGLCLLARLIFGTGGSTTSSK